MMSTTTDTRGAGGPSAKWGKAAHAGFQILPDVLLKHQHQLGLSTTELVVLINITMHWWYEDVKPFPRTTTIAARMGVAVRSVQRAMHGLQTKGLIERNKAVVDGLEQTTFDLSGLVKELEKYAVKDPAYRPRLHRKPEHAPAEIPF